MIGYDEYIVCMKGRVKIIWQDKNILTGTGPSGEATLIPTRSVFVEAGTKYRMVFEEVGTLVTLNGVVQPNREHPNIIGHQQYVEPVPFRISTLEEMMPPKVARRQKEKQAGY